MCNMRIVHASASMLSEVSISGVQHFAPNLQHNVPCSITTTITIITIITVEEEAEWLLLDLILISNNNNDNMFYYYILLCIYVARFCVHCFPRWRLPAHER